MNIPSISLSALLAIAIGFPALGADPTLTLVKPAAAQGAQVDLLVLNESAEPMKYVPAGRIPCHVTTGSGSSDSDLVLVSPSQPMTLAPGQFVRVPYKLEAPAAGHIAIALPTQATAVSLDVPASSVVAPPQRAARPANPVEAILKPDPSVHTDFGIVEYLSYRIQAYEPVYFLAGPERPNGKFQFSFKYQVMGAQSTIAEKYPVFSGLYFAYSQTSFWDLQGDSKPFFDNSYRPEVFYAAENLERFFTSDGLAPDHFESRVQVGAKHESNGRDDSPVKFDGHQTYASGSRSLNTVYVRPILTFKQDDFFITIAPTLYSYVGDTSDNPDIAEFRGYGDLKVVVGERGGLQLAAIGRVGNHWDKGSLELDLSFPIRESLDRNFDVYLYSQFFTGYGESLLGYNDADNSFRIGFALVR